MKTIMVVFSATTIQDNVAEFAIKKAKEENARLVLLSIRDRNISGKVSKMVSNTSFLGKGVMDQLQKEIKEERGHIIDAKLNKIKQKAEDQGVLTEIEMVKGAFIENILQVAKEKKVSTIIVQRRLNEPHIEAPYEIISIK